MTPDNKNWHSDVESKMVLETENDITWSVVADVVIVGLGGAGVAAALESIESGNSVLAIDKYESGGATKASGGVIYAGVEQVCKKRQESKILPKICLTI